MASVAVRTPYESFFAANNKEDQRILLSSGLKFVKDDLDNSGIHFAYQLSSEKKEIVNNLGISIHPVPFLTHSHPFCKIMENNILLNILPDLMGNGKWIFSSIKKRKVDTIIKKGGKQSSNVSFVNKAICAKDFSRYDLEPSSYEHRVNVSSRDFVFPKTYLKSCHSSKIFIHDEVHHWSLSDMIFFLNEVEPKMLTFSIVYPPELLGGIKQAQNPRLYDFLVSEEKGKLFFFPDGCRSEAYEQPLRLDWLFSASHFDTGSRTYTVKLIKSMYAHHLFQVVPGEFVTESKRFFADFDTVDLTIIHKQRFLYYDYIPIKRKHIQKVYSYLLCLKKPDVESGLAKLRQMFEDEQDCRVVEFFSKFCKDVIEKHKNKWDIYGFGFIEKLSLNFIDCLPTPIARLFSKWHGKNIFDFLYNLGTLSIEVDTRKISKSFLQVTYENVTRVDSFADNLPNSIDRAWNFGDFGAIRTQHWVTRVMQKHNLSLFVNGGKERVSILLYLGSQRRVASMDIDLIASFRNKMTEEDFSLLICAYRFILKELGIRLFSRSLSYSRPGPFVCPEWYMMEIKEREMRMRKEEEIKRKREGKVQDSALLDLEDSDFERFKVCADLQVEGWYVKVNFSFLNLEEAIEVKEPAGQEVLQVKQISREANGCVSSNVPETSVAPCKEEQQLDFNGQGVRLEVESLESVEELDLSDSCLISFVEKEPVVPMKIINIEKDGNCFYRALAVCLGKDDSSYMHTRSVIVSEFERRTGTELNKRIKHLMTTDGEFTDDDHVFIAVNALNLELRISTLSNFGVFVTYSPSLISYADKCTVVHMDLTNEHFSSVVEDSVEPNAVPFTFGICEFPDLMELDTSNFKSTKLNGREAYFLVSDPDIDYSHGKVRYKPNLFDVESLCPENLFRGFNACLIQIFDESSSIGFHRDDEVCYDNDAILSINLKGEAIFSVEKESKREDFKMFPGHYIWIDGGKKGMRHSVSGTTSGRVNVTFRKHLRSMGGVPIGDLKSEFSKCRSNCLLKAIADNEKRSPWQILLALMRKDKEYWLEWIRRDSGGDLNDLIKASEDLRFSFNIEIDDDIRSFLKGGPLFSFRLRDNHFSKFDLNVNGRLVTELDIRSSHCDLRGKEKKKEVFLSKLDFCVSNSPGFNQFTFNADTEYASKLICSFKDRSTGVSLSDIYSNGGAIFEDSISRISKIINGNVSADSVEPAKINCIIGFGGSGKSRCIQEFLKINKSGKFMVISPRVNLSIDWLSKVGCSEKKIRTFETALRTDLQKCEVIILDEMTLFPNGYLDLLITMIDSMVDLKRMLKRPYFLCIFDAMQSRYHSDLDSLRLGDEHDVDRLIKGENVSYLLQSYRMQSKMLKGMFGDIVRDVIFNEDERPSIYDCHLKGSLVESSKGRPIDVILVASRDEKKVLSGSTNVMTFGESQGLTFDRTMIILSEHSERQDEYRWLVALTRAKKSICFLTMYRGGLSAFMQNCGSKLICGILRGEVCSERRLRMMMPSKDVKFVQSPRGGSCDEVDREDRLEGDPFLKPFIFLGQRINSQDVEICEVECVEPKGKVHLCQSQENFAQSRNFDLIRAKELREFRIRDSTSNQFCESYERIGTGASLHTSGPMRFEAIYPRHQSNDDVTFWMAVHKRLRFSNEATERAKLKDAGGIGQLMYYNLKQKLDLDFRGDPNLLEQCFNDFEYKKLLKSKATIANHSNRSDMDWALNDIFLFMKSQLCTKYEKQYVDAKAGQTLACFQHMILVKFAPYCRYMEALIRRQLPEEIYIHSNKNFDDLNEWVIKFFKNDICVESDYEAFDASQDEYIVAFEIAMMEDMGMPNWFINEYIDLKCTLGCKLGHFAIMRFTGEFCTFLFNTMANMAFTFCRYEWERGQPIAFAGDDMCALNNLQVTDKFDEVFEKISLKAKVIRTEVPMFCGWRLSRFGIIKEPELIYNRFMVAKERGNIQECLENYAIELSYAYSLGERLYLVLKSEEQIEYHQSVVRFVVQNLGKLKTKVKHLYSDQCDGQIR